MIGDDVGGIAVPIGARLAALAGASGVLVSSTVKDLVAGSGLRFADRGTKALKGIPGEWRIFAAERYSTSRVVPSLCNIVCSPLNVPSARKRAMSSVIRSRSRENVTPQSVSRKSSIWL